MGFNDIEVTENEVTLLIIKNNHLFAKIVKLLSLYGDKEYNNEELILVDKDNIMKIKDFELITDIIHLSLNDKKILSSIYQNIQDSLILNNDLYEKYNTSILNINKVILNELNNYNISFTYDIELPINSYLKTINVKIEDDLNELVFSKLLDYIEIYSELFPNNLLIFVGVVSYLDDQELNELFKYIVYKKIKCLFIENLDSRKINCKKYIIFDDFSEDIY